MYWKEPCTAGLFQVGFGVLASDRVFVTKLPEGVTNARLMFGSCDSSAFHGTLAWDVASAAPLSLRVNDTWTYWLARSEILSLGTMVSHIYLRDEGDSPPPSVAANMAYDAAVNVQDKDAMSAAVMAGGAALVAQRDDEAAMRLAFSSAPKIVAA